MRNLVTRMIAVAALAGSALLGQAAVAEEAKYAKQKVVYHINSDDPQLEQGALRNIQNHINAVGKDNLELKVVLHGDGLALLLEPAALAKTKMKQANADDKMTAMIDGLKQQGVKFDVCANTLKGKQVDKADLYDVSDADIVPSGVAELAKLQGEGYVYIKP